MTLFIVGLLCRESSSEDVREGDEPVEVLRSCRCSSSSFKSTASVFGLVGGVSKDDPPTGAGPRPRPTRIRIISLLDRTNERTSARTELTTITSDTVDLLLVFVDVARVQQSAAGA